MKLLKKVLAGVAVAAAMASASASMITVGGVSWDPDAASDFSSTTANMRQFINTTTGELSGFGVLTSMNSLSNAQFCAGCELTFQFSGFNLTSGTPIPGIGATGGYTGGTVNFYVGAIEIGNVNDFDALTWANTGATNSTLWLSAVNSGVFLGTNFANAQLSGLGFLNVTGGLAESNFNTNTQTGGTDFKFSTSLNYQRVDGDVTDVSGTGILRGNSIPEPESLALVGLGLLGLAAARRRKQA